MKTILLPFQDDPIAIAALEQACLVARRFDSHIEGLFIARPPQIIEAEGIALAGAYVSQLKDEWQRRADEARGRFEQLMSDRGVQMRPLAAEGTGVSASWRDMEGPEGQVIGDYGRLFDLIIVGRSGESALVDWQVLCEAAFFESGKPTLVAGAEPREMLGETVVVSWNGSTEAARTVALGMPFLEQAGNLVVLADTDVSVPGPSGQDVTAHLRRRGLDAEYLEITSGSRSPGEAILDECTKLGADLLLKGAYTHNRLRQLVFGGATRHILSHAELPVLMAH